MTDRYMGFRTTARVLATASAVLLSIGHFPASRTTIRREDGCGRRPRGRPEDSSFELAKREPLVAEAWALASSWRASDKRKALEKLETLRRTSIERGDSTLEEWVLVRLGEIHRALGRATTSLDYFRQLLLSSADPEVRIQAHMRLSRSLVQLHDLAAGQQHARSAARLSRDLDGEALEAEALFAPGVGDSAREVVSAEDLLERAGGLFSRLGEAGTLTEDIFRRGIAHTDLSREWTAMESFRKAVILSRRRNERRVEAIALPGSGEPYAFEDDPLQAGIEGPREALENPLDPWTDPRGGGEQRAEVAVLDEIATLAADMGMKEEALRTFAEAVAIARANGFEREEADLLNGVGAIELSQGRIAEARARFQRALDLSRKTDSASSEARALFALARLDRDRERFDEALSRTEEALQRVEALRSQIASHRLRVSYVASVYELHAFHVELLMELDRRRPGSGFAARAFLAADRARARTLLEMLLQTEDDGFAGADETLVDYETRLEDRIRREAARPGPCGGEGVSEEPRSSQLHDLLAELDRVRAALRNRYSPAARGASEPVEAREIQKVLLDDDTALLSYFLGDRMSYVWTVTPSRISAHTLPSRERIEGEARKLYEVLSTRDPRTNETAKERYDRNQRSDDEYRRLAHGLGETLLGEAVSGLDVERLVIVGDGALNRIPFSALHSPAVHPEGERVPLVARYEIVRLPSVAIWKALLGRRPRSSAPGKRLAVLADPVFDAVDPRLWPRGKPTLDEPEDLPRLLSTRNEAKRILELVPEGEGFEALGFDASLRLVESGALADFEVIHFATHGVVNSEHPELSGIVLSLFDPEGNAEKGFLRLHDIYELKLPARLVVLSACSTGWGKEVRGEGLVGLVGGFLSSGSRGVIASYWDIEDEGTAELMSRFYRYLFTEGLSPSKALQMAQRSMWSEKRWLSPEIWGAFEFQGVS